MASPCSVAVPETSTPPAMDSLFPSPQLTPRSKVRATLAAVSEDSDSDGQNNPKGKEQNAKELATLNRNRLEEENSQAIRTTTDVVEDEEDDAPILPRGNLAARLNRQKNKRQVSSRISEAESDKENAYARVKKQLMRKTMQMTEATAQEDGRRDVGASSRASVYRTPSPLLAKVIDETMPGALLQTGPSQDQGILPGTLAMPASAPRVSSQPISAVENASSDSDLPENPHRNSKFFELVARKQAERLAKQAEEEIKKERRARQESTEDRENDGTGRLFDTEDGDIDRKLTQHNRPTRKASKRALEEMSRETQRMSRNMQLSHQARTKKKITKESLLARFQIGGAAVQSLTNTVNNAMDQQASDPASSINASDHEKPSQKETPPTSALQPEEPESHEPKQTFVEANTRLEDPLPSALINEHDELPDMTDILSQPISSFDKGKGRALESNESIKPTEDQKLKNPDSRRRSIKIHLPQLPPRGSVGVTDPDSDLEVVPSCKSKRKLDVFQRMPKVKSQDVRPLQNLRVLAHLNSPPRENRGKGRSSLSSVGMQISLQQRARQQAVEERKAKIEDLKARGIVVQTAEEKEKEQVEVEDLLEKARRENEAIRAKERLAARREKLANVDAQSLDESSDDDEDYEEDGTGQQDIDLSGSEDDEEASENSEEEPERSDKDEDNDIDDGLHEQKELSGLIDGQASDDSRNEEDFEADDEDEDEGEEEHEETIANMEAQRPRRPRRIIDEDDEVEDEYVSPSVIDQKASPSKVPTVEVPVLFQDKPNSVLMGMTQAFAATMAETQAQYDDREVKGDSLLFSHPPDPTTPILQVEDSILMVEDTQETQQPSLPLAETVPANRIDLHFSQSQISYDEASTQRQAAATQLSEIPDPTQDAGFVMSSPAPEQRFVSEPPSTVDTVIVPGAVGTDSPIIKKRGRLHRGKLNEQRSDHDSASNKQAGNTSQSDPEDAFSIMKKARKKAAQREDFIKKKSEAKDMVEEQAQESEDEYAGLGGASDDESGGEDDDFDKEMIDREKVDVQERKLAAFHADKERKADEAEIQKIHKDIHNGGFRRKRTTEFDLSDSDDDVEARRRRKQREFAKMRKALLENENVGKIAEDPKKMAFLKAIEDRDDVGDLDFLHQPAEDSFRVEMASQEEGESQSQQQGQQPVPTYLASNKRKRVLEEAAPDKTNMRPPATSRRTQPSKRPATLEEIRESVSFLIEEPGSIPLIDASSSASEDEETIIHSTIRDENHRHPRRTNSNPIIDRLTLKRQSFSSASTSSNLAFHSSTTSMANTFFPSLLRRATTSSLGNSQAADVNGISHAATERAAGGGEKGDFVRRGGTKRSSVNFAARETQKGRVVEGVERRRREERQRVARERFGGLISLSRTSTWES